MHYKRFSMLVSSLQILTAKYSISDYISFTQHPSIIRQLSRHFPRGHFLEAVCFHPEGNVLDNGPSRSGVHHCFLIQWLGCCY